MDAIMPFSLRCHGCGTDRIIIDVREWCPRCWPTTKQEAVRRVLAVPPVPGIGCGTTTGGFMTLQDATTTGSQEAETPAESQGSTAARADRIKVSYDVGAGAVTVQDGDSVRTHSLDGIPEPVRTHLALMGLHVATHRSIDAAETVRRMQAGQIPGRASAQPKVELSDWRLAYAHAKVEQTKKLDSPLSLDDAKAVAKALTREQLGDIKKHPLVVKHYNKLTGASADLI